WSAAGELEFLGRIDHQVKVRGFRIELGEVESALMRAGVRDTVVLAREDAPGDKQLVAYVVGDADASELRERLKSELADYMLPSAFVFLDAFPHTPNGKIDRRALPAPDAAATHVEYVAPRDEREAALASAWADVLGVPRVGVKDDFFDLG